MNSSDLPIIPSSDNVYFLSSGAANQRWPTALGSNATGFKTFQLTLSGQNDGLIEEPVGSA